ncbi:hypothetical protein H6P81_004677 [Aristolochia fimbriata]|uniref:Uncharacterized protein n=1 Tax=Aristolochia fimbriata TaxID=158543 RepID=A0AAV7EWV1_ARIFI|nr:hypothetical protein H6P81_004677 [Aristolochia fimbriata]
MTAAMRLISSNHRSSVAALQLAVFIVLIIASFQYEGVKGDVACIADCSDFPACTPAACDGECLKNGFKNGGSWVYYSFNLHCCCNLPAAAAP